ncbi:uncharacterized protein LOC128236664 [Mya arenaria]|uniref:uncharacterized protein LOC128236664 n=1 Tax=Mya arenaria TaxID=6604 RepID=UPI0022E472DD|nr:uncharacterized protein LOC128236664 [Mya arenaria]
MAEGQSPPNSKTAYIPDEENEDDEFVSELHMLQSLPETSMADIENDFIKSKTPPPRPRPTKRSVLVGRGTARLRTRPASTPLRMSSPVDDVHTTRRSLSRESARIQQGSRMEVIEETTDKSEKVLSSVTQNKAHVKMIRGIAHSTKKKLHLHHVCHSSAEKDDNGSRALRSAVQIAKAHNIVMLSGKPGSGKTHIALDLLTTLTDPDHDTVPLIFENLQYIKLLQDTSVHAVVLVDDCFGTGKLNKIRVNQFKDILKSTTEMINKKRITLVLTSENDILEVLRDDSNRNIQSFIQSDKYRVDFDSNEYKLTDKEKMDLLYLYMPNIKHQSVDIAQQLNGHQCQIGFPLMCSLSQCAKMENLSNFFADPFQYIVEKINTLKEDNFSSYVLLVLILIMDRHYPASGLSNVDKKHFMTLLQMYKPLKCSYIEVSNSVQLMKDMNFIVEDEENCLQFSHRIIFLAILYTLLDNDFSSIFEILPVSAFLEISLVIEDSEETFCTDLDEGKFKKTVTKPMCRTFVDVIQKAIKTKPMHFEQIACLDVWDQQLFFDLFLEKISLEICMVPDENGMVFASHLLWADHLSVIHRLGESLKKMKGNISSMLVDGVADLVSSALEIKANIEFTAFLKFCTEGHKQVVMSAVASGSIELIDLVCNPVFALYPSTTDLMKIACRMGKVEIAKYLIEKTDADILSGLKRRKDQAGEALIHIASKSGETDILQLLEQNGFDMKVQTSDGNTILDVASMFGKTSLVRYICSKYPTLIGYTNNFGMSCAHYAVREGHLDTFQLLVSMGADPTIKVDGGNTMFHLAAANGHTSVLRFIWDKYENLQNIKNDESFMPQQIAARKGNIETLSFFLSQGVDPNERTVDGRSFVHLAAFSGHVELVQYLCIKYPNMAQAIDRDGNSPALDASAGGSVDVLSYLVENFIDPYVVSADGCTLLHEACYFGNIENVQYLCRNFKNLVLTQSNHGYTCCHAASLGGFVDILKFLEASGADYLGVAKDGSTLLHEAAFAGKAKMVEFILSFQPNMALVKNKRSYLPSHFAAQEGHIDILLKFIEVMPNKMMPTTEEGQTYLHIAAYNGKRLIIQKMCDMFPDMLLMEDVNAAQALHYAARGGFVNVLEDLIARGSNPMSQTVSGSTILHLASFDAHLELVNHICRKYPFLLNVLDNSGHNAAHYSAGSGNLPVLKLLIDKGIDCLALTSNGSTLLLKAAYSGNIDMMKYLCQTFPDMIPLKDEYGCTVLHYTASGGHIDAFKFLVDQGMEVMAKTKDGHTVLHMAAYHGQKKTAQFLCSEYPDLRNVTDNNAQTAYVYAKIGDHKSKMRLLKPKTENGQGGSAPFLTRITAILCFCRRRDTLSS